MGVVITSTTFVRVGYRYEYVVGFTVWPEGWVASKAWSSWEEERKREVWKPRGKLSRSVWRKQDKDSLNVRLTSTKFEIMWNICAIFIASRVWTWMGKGYCTSCSGLKFNRTCVSSMGSNYYPVILSTLGWWCYGEWHSDLCVKSVSDFVFAWEPAILVGKIWIGKLHAFHTYHLSSTHTTNRWGPSSVQLHRVRRSAGRIQTTRPLSSRFSGPTNLCLTIGYVILQVMRCRILSVKGKGCYYLEGI